MNLTDTFQDISMIQFTRSRERYLIGYHLGKNLFFLNPSAKKPGTAQWRKCNIIAVGFLGDVGVRD